MIKVEKQANGLANGITYMMNAMIEDYNNFCSRQDMQEEYKKELRTIAGKKYIKVVAKGVKCFIMLNDDDKFKKGDILFPASWNAPARNKARGNVLEGNYYIEWTGALYL